MVVRGFPSFVVALFATVVLVAGCSNSSHPNDPRPPIPTAVGVAISSSGIEVNPRAIGVPLDRQANVNQNNRAPQSPSESDAPLVTEFSLSNQTSVPGELRLEGPVNRKVQLTAGGSGSFQAALPAGIYRLSADVSTGTTRMLVGRTRFSSSGDLLTP